MDVHRFYEVVDDVSRPGRWHLSEPRAQGHLAFPRGTDLIHGQAADVAGSLVAYVSVAGDPLDFTFAAFGVPIVRTELADLIERAAPGTVQRIPVDVPGRSAEYEVLNIVAVVDCLDADRSQVTRWTEADGVPELVGTYFSVLNPVIDASRADGGAMFRIDGWFVPVVVNEVVAQLLKGRTGVILQPLRVVNGA